jgi:hypothetical protein
MEFAYLLLVHTAALLRYYTTLILYYALHEMENQ